LNGAESSKYSRTCVTTGYVYSTITYLFSFAFVLHTQFVTSDRSVENIANLKRTHSLMPYRTVAQILKLSNPFSMVKGVLDLFLAQPFGGKSLFQR
jgi:hypothetical protein